MKPAEVLDLAGKIISGPRREAYGDAKKSFKVIAKMWSEVLGITVTPKQVALCMIALKVCREVNSTHDDNLVDICGYAALAAGL